MNPKDFDAMFNLLLFGLPFAAFGFGMFLGWLLL